MEPKPEKTCASCGRMFTWRRRSAANWENVRYCSVRCRKDRAERSQSHLDELIIAVVRQHKAGTSICPSEVARRVQLGSDWRRWMEPVRCAARRLVASDKLVITQQGRAVDPSQARGAIRLRLEPKTQQ